VNDEAALPGRPASVNDLRPPTIPDAPACPHCGFVFSRSRPGLDDREQAWREEVDRAASRFQNRKRLGLLARFELPPSLRKAA
jgi:hypothetical protein